MPKKIILFSGSSAVGKTSVLQKLLPYVKHKSIHPMVCKIDCIESNDENIFTSLGIPCITGLSKDICPDHYLVSNFPEIQLYADKHSYDYLFIETAGLCHRCSPATRLSIAGCVLDCTASSKSPNRLGPMLTEADFIVLTKIDMISQAELEILRWMIHSINPAASIFPVDGLAGYGIEFLADWLLLQDECSSFEKDSLRHTMPAGVCSYCLGEQRVGPSFQQGVIHKMDFKENTL